MGTVCTALLYIFTKAKPSLDRVEAAAEAAESSKTFDRFDRKLRSGMTEISRDSILFYNETQSLNRYLKVSGLDGTDASKQKQSKDSFLEGER